MQIESRINFTVQTETIPCCTACYLDSEHADFVFVLSTRIIPQTFNSEEYSSSYCL